MFNFMYNNEEYFKKLVKEMNDDKLIKMSETLEKYVKNI